MPWRASFGSDKDGEAMFYEGNATCYFSVNRIKLPRRFDATLRLVLHVFGQYCPKSDFIRCAQSSLLISGDFLLTNGRSVQS